ncbi:PrpR N-terminal domain-containing protein [Oscillospiraceae bacterium PP1C4]
MAKLAFLAPRPEMIEYAHQISLEMGIEDIWMEVVDTPRSVERARHVVSAGADIIIARGYQASLIRHSLNTPVVDLRLTGQEMGILVARAKRMLGLDCPTIGVVGHANMFCDMSYFDSIYNIKIQQYFYETSEWFADGLEKQINKAISDHVDMIIGGDIALSSAKKAGIPSLFISSTEDSVREAFRVAQSVAYASELEKKNTAEFKTLLDYSFSVEVKLNEQGRIMIVNHLAEKLLDWNAQRVVGQALTDITDAISNEMLASVLEQGKEIYSVFININNISLVANLAPIQAGGVISGAIFSCQEVRRLEEMGAAARQEFYQLGYVAKYNFSMLEVYSQQLQQTLSLAKLYAQSDAPIVIGGKIGGEHALLAQCIHNASLRKNGPYITVECDGTDNDEQLSVLFGAADSTQSKGARKGLFTMSHGGTIYLKEVNKLSGLGQLKLLKLLTDKVLMIPGETRPLPLDVRVIAFSECSLSALVEQGKFNKQLFYTLNILTLDVPPLHERPNDICSWAEKFIKQFSDQYKRYITLTKGAKQYLCDYMWCEDLTQLRSFCECMVLTASHRSVDETFVSQLLYRMYPLVRQKRPAEKVVVYKDPEAAVISDLLEKHDGNRGAVAKEMRISTTTLWRKIKKHNIVGKFGF